VDKASGKADTETRVGRTLVSDAFDLDFDFAFVLTTEARSTVEERTLQRM
jgi:hypothetical protein